MHLVSCFLVIAIKSCFKTLNSLQLSMKRLGAQLCGMFAEIEGEQFEHRFHEILPIITELISAAKTEEVNFFIFF